MLDEAAEIRDEQGSDVQTWDGCAGGEQESGGSKMRLRQADGMVIWLWMI